jgi:hypothetical protein
MKCPKCHSEVADWHYYCPNCHTLVQDVAPESGRTPEGMVERAGRRLLDLLFGVFIAGLLIVMARQIEWRSLLRALRGDPATPAETREMRKGRGNPAPTRQSGGTKSTPADDLDGNLKTERPAKAESVRSLPQAIEELPSPVTQEDSLPSKAAGGEPSPQSNPRPESHPPNGDPVELGVDRLEPKQNRVVGVVAVSSYVPARIYVDGQFSGLTPRTVILAAGDYQIRLIADGYEDWTRRIHLKPSQQIGIIAPMKKKAASQN